MAQSIESKWTCPKCTDVWTDRCEENACPYYRWAHSLGAAPPRYVTEAEMRTWWPTSWSDDDTKEQKALRAAYCQGVIDCTGEPLDTTKLNRGQVIQRIMRVMDHNDSGSGGIAKLAEKIAEGIFSLPQSFQIGGKNETLLLKEKLDTRLNDHLSEMKPNFDDSIAGFNEAWDIVRKLFIELGVAEEGIRTTPLHLCTICKKHSTEPCDKGLPTMRLGCRQFKEKDYYEQPEIDYPEVSRRSNDGVLETKSPGSEWIGDSPKNPL